MFLLAKIMYAFLPLKPLIVFRRLLLLADSDRIVVAVGNTVTSLIMVLPVLLLVGVLLEMLL